MMMMMMMVVVVFLVLLLGLGRTNELMMNGIRPLMTNFQGWMVVGFDRLRCRMILTGRTSLVTMRMG